MLKHTWVTQKANDLKHSTNKPSQRLGLNPTLHTQKPSSAAEFLKFTQSPSRQCEILTAKYVSTMGEVGLDNCYH